MLEQRQTGKEGRRKQIQWQRVVGAEIISPVPYLGPVLRESVLSEQEREEKGQDMPLVRMKQFILDHKEMQAWPIFNSVVRSKQASIWHWEVMLGLVARDPSVSLQEVLELACVGKRYESSAIFDSLKDPLSDGNITHHREIISFTLMHNLGKRRTRKADECAMSVWDAYVEQGVKPNMRMVDEKCVILVRLGQTKEAIQELGRFTMPTMEGRRPRLRATAYTIAKLMYALLEADLPRSVYEVYKMGKSEAYRVSTHDSMLNILFRASQIAYGNLLSNKERTAEEEGHDKAQMLWDGAPAALQAESIFLAHLFSQHPELKQMDSPLYDGQTGDRAGLMWKVEMQMERWTGRFSQWFPSTRHRFHLRGAQEEGLVSGNGDGVHTPQRERIDFNDQLFHSYFHNLPLIRKETEVPWDSYLRAMAWMKSLGVKPNRYTLISICYALDHLCPPLAEDSPDSAAGPLHHYMAEWLGESCIPRRSDVYLYFRHQLKRGLSL